MNRHDSQGHLNDGQGHQRRLEGLGGGQVERARTRTLGNPHFGRPQRRGPLGRCGEQEKHRGEKKQVVVGAKLELGG